MAVSRKANAHHHGKLRDALIDAGIALLAEGGPEGLTLRKAAARAGVSHAAPAHHFEGLPGLRTAIAHRGFQMFLDRLLAAESAAPAEAFARLTQANLAYLDFADRNAALFRLMFAELQHAKPALSDTAIRCYAVLQRNCAPFCGAEDNAGLETAVWALTHGYATLGLAHARPNAPAPTPSYQSLLRLLLRQPEDDSPPPAPDRGGN